jgi:hypothetical protein
VKFDLESVKRVLAETDLNSGNLFILRLPNLSVSLLSSPSWNGCLFVIKSELNSALVESESELCTRDNNTSHISFNYLYNPTLSAKSVCGDVLTCIPLFIDSCFGAFRTVSLLQESRCKTGRTGAINAQVR